MAKKVISEEYDHETGELVDVETLEVSHSEVREDLAALKAQDKDKVFEWPDPRPMAPPLGFHPEPSLAERIRNMVRSEHLRLAAEGSGMETFEEADDFDVDDDFDPSSPYEMFFDQPIVSPEASPTGVPQPVNGAGNGTGEAPAAGGGGPQAPSGNQTGTA